MAELIPQRKGSRGTGRQPRTVGRTSVWPGSRQRRPGLRRGGGVALILSGLVLLVPQVLDNSVGNTEVRQRAQQTVDQVERDWRATQPKSPARNGHAPSYPSRFAPAQVFAVLDIPAIGLTAPVAEGVDKASVLDRGWVGHYSGTQETAFPWQSAGNFAVAAHRNTHGEPFRRLDEVKPGDEVVVSTAAEFFVYRVTGGLPEVSPHDVGVLRPVPVGSGFTRPGRYITLTTCTPDFTSWYRLIRFGVLVRTVPRALQPTGIPGL